MPKYQVKAPDGATYEYDVPEGTNPNDVIAHAQASYQAAPGSIRTNDDGSTDTLGADGQYYVTTPPPPANPALKGGAGQFVGGLASNLLGPQISRAAADVAGAIQTPFSDKTLSENMADSEHRIDNTREAFAQNHPWLTPVANVVGSIPVAARRGGAALLGGINGALQSDSRSPLGIGLNAVEGAVGGVVGDRLIRGAAQFLGPTVSPYIRALGDRVSSALTPGQTVRTLGGRASQFLAGLEDKATSLPIVGDMIANDRRAAQQAFTNGAAQRALDPVGETLPANIDNGNDAVAFTRRAMTRAYNRALAGMQLVPDQQFTADGRALAQRLSDGTLSRESADQFANTVDSVVTQRLHANGGVMDGETLKSVDSELRKRAVAAQNRDPALATAIYDMRNAVRSAASRSSSPEAVQQLQNADQAYANYVRVRRAAAAAQEGNFSPNQLFQAVKASDTTTGKTAMAEGNALLQDYAQAGREVLPSRTGDSGTGARVATANPIAWGIGATAAPLYAGLRAASPLLRRQAGANAQLAANYLRASAPTVGASFNSYLGAPVVQGGIIAGSDAIDTGRRLRSILP